MDPKIIDYYNEMPSGVNVIDKMNEELLEIQNELDKYHKIMKKFIMPRIKINNIQEYYEFEKKILEYENFLISYSSPSRTWDHSSNRKTMIDLLDNLTNNLNREWCEHRIDISIETFKKIESRIHYRNPQRVFKDLVFGINDYGDLPSIYYDMCKLYIPEWGNNTILNIPHFKRDENILNISHWKRDKNHRILNIFNIPYYNCKNCDKKEYCYTRYIYDTESEIRALCPDKNNNLLCKDCQN